MSGRYRWRTGLAVCVLLGPMLLVGCEGGANLPEASGSASLPTGSLLPTGSRTAPTASRSVEAPTSSRAEDDPTESASATISEETAAASTPADGSTADADDADSEESSDSWWVWLLAVAALVAGIVWFVLAGAHRRKWNSAYATELLEARWAADTLMPSVTDGSASADEVTERWRRGKPRLDHLLTELSRLADTAAGSRRSSQAAQVSGAAAALGQALPEVVIARRAGTGSTGAPTGELEESRRLARERADALLDAIAAPGP